ncbi:MAG: FKBP-type peptidyl-prolyl cis-trans isomerase [Paludibacteraceae bacterium]|nr:FKBP-type peptidyl-prolyl cis-trans isomerase [Paludibacteraceae bacterium]MBO7338127.1 FKBP-type peptidyl-prolyl cis-trans isomerase [Paludibacteraceae bacterium]MBP5742232.1 FKBP-type peptidyl-prolyl cis-trans isomerase [Paludibacteraceae bacterium]
MKARVLRYLLFIAAVLTPSVFVSCEDEYEDTKDAGETYIKNVDESDVVTLNTGLKYKKYFEEDPSWPSVPALPGFIKLNYTAMFINGDTLSSGTNATFLYSNMIDGCKQAIKRMKVGSKWRLWIPYYLAYGSDGVNDGTVKVDPYTALIYDIELIGVTAN